jgi:hypothetical protein
MISFAVGEETFHMAGALALFKRLNVSEHVTSVRFIITDRLHLYSFLWWGDPGLHFGGIVFPPSWACPTSVL